MQKTDFKIFFRNPLFSKIEKSKNFRNLKSGVRVSGLSSEIQKVVKMGSFLRLDPLEQRLEGKNSPDFYVANASIFGPFRSILSEIWHFEIFENFSNFLGRCSKLSAGSERCFWADF